MIINSAKLHVDVKIYIWRHLKPIKKTKKCESEALILKKLNPSLLYSLFQ